MVDPSGLLLGIPGTPSASDLINSVAGFGDAASLGARKWARQQLGDDNVDYCSSSYSDGSGTGQAFALLAPGEGEELAAVDAIEDATKAISDETVLVRGGTNTADRVAGGSGVTTDATGNVHGVCQLGPHGGVRRSRNPAQSSGSDDGGRCPPGGWIGHADPTPGNSGHCLIGGCSAETISDLLRPTIPNPARK
jgi:hypothetical protein